MQNRKTAPLEGLCRAINRKNFNEFHKISTKFAGETGSGDGLTKEMCQLAFHAIQRTAIFTQSQKGLSLKYDAISKIRNIYQDYGKILSIILVVGEIAPKCFSPFLVDCLIGVEENEPQIDDVIFDERLKRDLQQLNQCETAGEANRIILDSNILNILKSSYVASCEEAKETVKGWYNFTFNL